MKERFCVDVAEIVGWKNGKRDEGGRIEIKGREKERWERCRSRGKG